MKTLLDYINEELATPANTLGMGGVDPTNEPAPSEVNGFVILKPGFCNHEDEWCKMLGNNGWKIIQKKKFKMTPETAKALYTMHKSKPFYDNLCTYMSSDDCICAMCYKDCEDPIGDMKTIKDKVRNAWGIDDMKNAMHSSDSLDNVKREYGLIFENKLGTN